MIVDSHHHVWRVQDNLWLQGPMVPRIFGPYEAIRRDYLADEFIADATGAGVGRSVYVQTNWPLERSLDEVRWVQQVHEESGWPHAIVGAADLFRDDAPALFEAQAEASPLMRGIRLQLHWHPNEQYRFASAPDRMKDPVLRRAPHSRYTRSAVPPSTAARTSSGRPASACRHAAMSER